MTKPASYPTWDSTKTNVTTTPAGWQNNGFATGDTLLSDVENYWRNLVDLWIEYFDIRNATAVWQWILPLGRPAAEVNITWSDTNSTATASPGPGLLDSIPVHVQTGGSITAIGARVLGTGAGSNVVVHLYKNLGDGAARALVDTLTITTPPASWATYTHTLGTPETVADATGYVLEVELPTTGQAVALVGAAIAAPG